MGLFSRFLSSSFAFDPRESHTSKKNAPDVYMRQCRSSTICAKHLGSSLVVIEEEKLSIS
jgi:hypothetical protein